ncbi:hypothetical protein D1007_56571 [Hordeum vulgare]|nr:hypothetical protein D1007_56571 [Hordeum vulgare]
MRAVFWNLRGFGNDGRRRQLMDYMREEDIDIVAISKTMQTEFSLSELERLSRHLFAWHWLPACGVAGHSGGILLGVKDTTFDVGSMDRGEFFMSMKVWERAANFKWEVIVVYGPTDHTRSQAFLDEMHQMIEATTLPLIIWGDFNLIRSTLDKNNARVGFPGVQRFNDWIADLGIQELDRVGAQFTWTNRQAIANGRRRRCTIPLLWDGDRLIQEPGEIRGHVDGFYKDLFAARPRSGITLAESIWNDKTGVSPAENTALLIPFEEVEGEVMVLGYTDEEKLSIANQHNCRVGTFPTTYLGMPISDSQILEKDLRPTMAKDQHRVEPWQGR